MLLPYGLAIEAQTKLDFSTVLLNVEVTKSLDLFFITVTFEHNKD